MSPSALDMRFVDAVARAADAEVSAALAILAEDYRAWPHRRLMEHVKLIVATCRFKHSIHHGTNAPLEVAHAMSLRLLELQMEDGLFYGGDNIASPPDSAFTINDACDTLELIRRSDQTEHLPLLAEIESVIGAVTDAAEGALVRGGIHTPNHRWEISAALARLHRRRPSPQAHRRILEWLGEGVDLNPDGTYSERSANYAAHVSNPSLTVIGDVLGIPSLHGAVAANLESTLALIHPDLTVETVHSRRQDQNSVFSLAPYLAMYRRYAIEHQRGDFAWAAHQALTAGVDGVATVLTELLLNPELSRELPAAEPPAASKKSLWTDAALAVDRRPERTLVVYGGSDYAQKSQVRSGLANNPTFMRMFAGGAVLDAVRLSRTFFGLGPFRADGLDSSSAGGGYIMRETTGANYYQPLSEGERRPEGQYALENDGRFHAAMSFSHRKRDRVDMATEVVVTPLPDGARIDIDLAGPKAAWALEFTFRGEGEFDGGEPLGNGDVHFTDGCGAYCLGSTEFIITSDVPHRSEAPPIYSPGEDYEFLGASDATTGRHAYLTGHSPGRFSIIVGARVDTSGKQE